jgi:outer membrane protein W
MKCTTLTIGLGLMLSVAPGAALAQEGTDAAEPAATDAPASETTEAEATTSAEGEAAMTADTAGGGADKKIKLGLRLGYGIPMGDTSKDNKLSDFVSSIIPIWIDAGYMVTPNIMVGLYFQYALANFKDCDDCSGNDMRFGVQGQYHISPAEKINPWLGLGIGYEILSESESDSSVKGMEFLNLQGGADFALADAIGVGPFVSFSLGQYSSAKFAGNEVPDFEKAMHQWLVIGAKGTFGL